MQQGSLLLRGGLVVTPSEAKQADILVAEGKILELGRGLAAGNATIVDIEGTVASRAA
jgi:dihydroorotase-like cyclic amidohydrolase